MCVPRAPRRARAVRIARRPAGATAAALALASGLLPPLLLARCERFSGARVATGAYAMTLSGAADAQWEGQATIERRSIFDGPDGYSVYLQRPNWWAGLVLSTRNRPGAGTYAVVPRDDGRPDEDPSGAFVALLTLVNGDPFFDGDSGRVVIRQVGGRLEGTFRVFLTDRIPRDTAKRQMVATGHFRL